MTDYKTGLSLELEGSLLPYSAEISRSNPSCFLFLIDQSGSMGDNWSAEGGRRKADGLATIMNRMLQNLTIRCAKSESVLHYYDVGVIGYGATVVPMLGGALAGGELVPINELADAPVRIEERIKKEDDGAGGLIERRVKMPIWFDPVASGGTPMCQALTRAHSILSHWVTEHPESFPPIVINITDGEATDGDPTQAADVLRGLTTRDGDVLLFNAHLSSQANSPIVFPDSEVALADRHAELLFRISSPMPEYMKGLAHVEGYPASDGARGYVFNADPVSIIQFLDIGTRPSNLR